MASGPFAGLGNLKRCRKIVHKVLVAETCIFLSAALIVASNQLIVQLVRLFSRLTEKLYCVYNGRYGLYDHS